MKILSHSGPLRTLTGKDNGNFILFHTRQVFQCFIKEQVFLTILGDIGKYTAPPSMARGFFCP